MIQMCQKILVVEPEIKRYVIKKYLGQIQKLSGICFYQRRREERADVCDADELEFQIGRIKEWLRR